MTTSSDYQFRPIPANSGMVYPIDGGAGMRKPGQIYLIVHQSNCFLLKLTRVRLIGFSLFHHLDTPWATLSPNKGIR